MLEAVKQSGRALRYASEVLQNDPQIVLEAVKQSGWALQYASAELRQLYGTTAKNMKEIIANVEAHLKESTQSVAATENPAKKRKVDPELERRLVMGAGAGPVEALAVDETAAAQVEVEAEGEQSVAPAAGPQENRRVVEAEAAEAEVAAGGGPEEIVVLIDDDEEQASATITSIRRRDIDATRKRNERHAKRARLQSAPDSDTVTPQAAPAAPGAVVVKAEPVVRDSGIDFTETIDLATHGAGQVPPNFAESDTLKRCPTCRHAVPIRLEQQRCGRAVCLRLSCGTEFCIHCGKVEVAGSRHMRCVSCSKNRNPNALT